MTEQMGGTVAEWIYGLAWTAFFVLIWLDWRPTVSMRNTRRKP